MTAIEVFSPAKINLLLAITGRREDGFHDLVSVVAPLKFGDVLQVEVMAGGGFTLECDDPAVPLDASNLVLKAAKLFKETAGEDRGARFVLKKRIPMGAGLGGGSSNAVAALLALNQVAKNPLTRETLLGLAEKLGSDCPLFLHGVPVVMRGRGEQVTPLHATASARLRGRRVLVFKPGFGIATAWAYGRMAAGAPATYLPGAEAEALLSRWIASGEPLEKLLYNNMERVAFEKYVAMPVLLEQLREKFNVAAVMSGSGSACFLLLAENSPAEEITRVIQTAWGPHTFILDTEIV